MIGGQRQRGRTARHGAGRGEVAAVARAPEGVTCDLDHAAQVGADERVHGVLAVEVLDARGLTVHGHAGQLTGVTVNGQPAAVQNLDGKYAVYSLICTHLGCVVEIAGDAFRCPCHGSDFSPTGAVTRGPATLPLPTYH